MRFSRAVLCLAALTLSMAFTGCRARPRSPASPAAPPTVAPSGTPEAARGGVEVALAAIAWPEGPAVARVNGVDVPTAAWREEVTRQLRLMTRQYDIDWNDPDNIARLPTILHRELEHLIDLELLRQLTAREELAALDSEVEEAAARAREQALASGQFADFGAFLEANELTEERFRLIVREQLMLERLLAAHGGPDEVEQVHVRHILVADGNKAQAVLTRLTAGESFEDLAALYSLDGGTRDQGGDLGWLPRGVVLPELEEAAFSLEPGETSAPIKSSLGYHIIRVDERGLRPLAEPLLTQVRQQRLVEWLDDQREAAAIERLYDPLSGAALAGR
ncbi:MAG: peptidylprolyl isomerase [Anaerolineae bacterium]|nr:peptidylprolyl isomerase [Anaerolineae bacterium]